MQTVSCTVFQGHFTPLTVATQQGHHQSVVVLLEAEADPKQQLPALHVAARKDEAKAAALLLRNGHGADLVTKVRYLVEL